MWLGSAGQSTKPARDLSAKLARLLPLERELYALRLREPPDDLQWLYDNLRLVRASVQIWKTR